MNEQTVMGNRLQLDRYYAFVRQFGPQLMASKPEALVTERFDQNGMPYIPSRAHTHVSCEVQTFDQGELLRAYVRYVIAERKLNGEVT